MQDGTVPKLMGDHRMLSKEVFTAARKAQTDEETGSRLYAFMAGREKDPHNKALLEQMSLDEKEHSKVWESLTGVRSKPKGAYILFMKILTVIMGFTFVVKMMQKLEDLAQDAYEMLEKEVPEAAGMLEDERRHETELYSMLDEERLHYVGAMVLGLNDALVELTGAIAGVTFALANTKLTAMTGIITGISATLSMAASNYLAEKANGNKKALKSSLYTGTAYLITVVFLVLPYLIMPSDMYIAAFAIMIAIVIIIILFFNMYISVAKEEPFLKRFLEMAVISLSVAVISFGIGLAAKHLLGIDV